MVIFPLIFLLFLPFLHFCCFSLPVVQCRQKQAGACLIANTGSSTHRMSSAGRNMPGSQ